MTGLTGDLDAFIESGTAMLGIPLRPEWQDAIRHHLGISFNFGLLIMDFPLPDEAEPAPVFGA